MISGILSAALSAVIATFIVMFIINKNGNDPYFLPVKDMFTQKNFKDACDQFKSGRAWFCLVITFIVAFIF